jgi:hypothetical protein
MGHTVEMIGKEAGSLVYLLKMTNQRNLSTSRKCQVYDCLVEEVVDISVGYGTPLSHSSI